MSLNLLFRIQPTVVFFIAPPAYGKTYKLIRLIEESSSDEIFIYVSPLRALADEFSEKFRIDFKLKNIRSFKEQRSKDKVFTKVYVITPELIDNNFLLMFSNVSTRFILDEFHLFSEWGKSFRPQMWDLIVDLLSHSFSLLLLSATLDQKLLDDFTSMVKHSSEYELFKLDLGNYQLKYRPEKIFHYSNCFQRFMLENIEYELYKKKKILVFCKYRNEVKSLEKKLSLKWRVLTCVGGKTVEFVNNLKKYEPDVIISTVALSHGVNLPRIDTVFINYEVKQKNMLLQMIARGGREGNQYSIHIMDDFYLKCENLISLIIYLIKVRVLNPFYNLKFKIQPS
ncbi:MAG: DEAD/DEAH box helicase [Bacteriovoracaceae bacterium]